MNKKDPYQGFTLFETLLVLWISSFFLLVPTLTLKNWRRTIEVRRFFNEFERNIQLIQQQAIVTNKKTGLEIKVASKKIIFFQREKIEDPMLQITLPESLDFANEITKKIQFTAGDGHYSGLGRIEFVRKKTNQKISYQFQMGGGRYIKNTE